MAELLGVVLILGSLMLLFAFIYKKRQWISRWLEDPQMVNSTDPKKKAKRIRKWIEEAQSELDAIEELNNLDD